MTGRNVSRRAVLSAGLGAGLTAAVSAVLSGCGPDTATWAEPGGTGSVGPTGPGPSATVATPSASATPGADLPAYGREAVRTLTRYLKPTKANPNHPTFAGASLLVMVDGKATVRTAVGDAVRYGAGPVELSAAKRVAMRPDSIHDLASITKVYTAILALQQVDRGRLDLSAPVASYLPDFDGPGKEAVTVAMLLAHTSGLPVGASVTGLPDAKARWAAVVATPLVKGQPPGAKFRYSSVGLMVLAMLVEKVTGKRLDAALKDGLTGPLGLRHTGFKPLGWLSSADRARLVATDARSSRGLLRGVVHDQVCNTLGGIAGHAGIFSTADEVGVIGQLLLDGGVYRGKRILAAETVRGMLTNVNPGLPAIDPDRPGRSADHGLGVELNQPWFMGRLASLKTFGHTGFTGTSLLVDQRRGLVLVLLTNRAHPNWSWANPDPVRAQVGDVLADGLH